MGKKHFLFFSNRRDREPNPNSGVKGSGANHYPRAPAPVGRGGETQRQVGKQLNHNNFPADTKHLYNICTMLDQRLRRWSNIVQINVIQMFCVYWVAL